VVSRMGKTLFSLLALVIILACLGCGEKVAQVNAAQLVDNALEAQVDVESYRLNMEMTIDMDGGFGGEEMEATMSIDASFLIDEANKEMEMRMAADMEATGEEAEAAEMKMYLIDNTVYMMMAVPDLGPMWIKQEVPADFWETQATIDQQLELLQDSRVKYLQDEKVEGVDCYVLEITPDLAQLWQTAMQQPWMEEVPMEIPNLEDMIKKVSVKQWIAKDTLFLTKVNIQITILVTSEAMGMPEEEGEMSMSIVMDMLAHDYNEPVSIELPAEARNAIEIPLDWST
jgi:outer membrane lipoprotein-sorting protein